MSPFSVDIRRLEKVFHHTPVVHDLTLSIHRGEFFSILGPSGSGKSTTLRLLAGLEQPTGGEIFIEGRPMLGVPPHRRPVNMVFQSYALFPHLTVAGNIGFGLRMKGLSKTEVRSKVMECLDLVRLAGKESRFPAQLSGGEQQRVALARALVNRPAVLLLDEPLGALDQQLRQSMQAELKTIQSEVGLTFLCVTHHQEEALTMSDRLAVMNRGKILQVGTPQDMYENPQSPFVAQFIGSTNQILLTVDSLLGHDVLAHHPALPSFPFRLESFHGAKVGGEATVMIRPEKIQLSRRYPGPKRENVVPVAVRQVLFAGNEWHYEVQLNDHLSWKARLPNSGRDGHFFERGETLYAHWNSSDTKVLRP